MMNVTRKKSAEQLQAERVSKTLRAEVKRLEKSGTRAEAVEILKGAGILDKGGNLAKPYRAAQ